VNRSGHRVRPGLYALGKPDENSPAFVTANYTLSFDALRSALAGIDAYILVLDTRGINVWCAAGKGTFGTEELIGRIESTGLADVVRHRRLIVPQLGAPGVAAHEVKRLAHFKVEYGPIRATDLPEYLKLGHAGAAMRRVRFPLRDRIVLVPVEIVATFLPMAVAAVILYFLSGWIGALAAVVSVEAGAALFPLLLPVLPTKDFSTKGLILGGVAALPFALAQLLGEPGLALLPRVLSALTFLVPMPAVTAYLALNFTGSTPFTSKSGVRHEMNRYVPIMAGMALAGIALMIAVLLLRLLGGY